jgi:hypothetical protein
MTARSHSAFCIRILLMTFGALYLLSHAVVGLVDWVKQ